ncbi:serine hydrolase [Nonomuraea sp. NEAU-A123]|uniref:serine hydrolase n=1 Tax=Nonomuraea sp. NEAU-A123 TaxID=2839649 RepID=UPI001BE42DF2|nr:serine hydrolase [Nonomuraea sp. NEAU-A123]MBT2231491.1 beta-lactamase family protein [Nonomuraea sp. NEAU-A123]
MGDPSTPYSRRTILHAGAALGALIGLEKGGMVPAAGLAECLVAGTARATGPFAWVARHNLTAAQYQAEFDRLAGQGYRLTHVDGYEAGGQALYAAIWERMPGPPLVTRHGLTGAQYQAEFNRLTGQGYRPAHVVGYQVGGQALFAAIWEQTGGPPWVARHNLTAAQYQAEFDRLLGQGYRLVHVDGYQAGGQALFAAIWEQTGGPPWVARHNLTAAQYQAEFDRLTGQGYRPMRVSGYTVGGTDLYAAIWARGAGPRWSARHGLSSADYQLAFDTHTSQGFRPARVSGYGSGTPRFAAIWWNQAPAAGDFAPVDAVVNRYLTGAGVAGISLAIARRGALVFARGYGRANRETGERLTERHLLRVASVSKPITSVAIMRLVEAGRLRLGQRVFGTGGVLGTRYGTQPYGTGIDAITIQHLLQHTAGGWTNDGNDPMFTNPGMNHAQLIGWVLDNRPLQHTPGTTYMYSNFGYCVLGRVIEQVTGQPYADHVRQSVLAPSGITNMHIAGDTRAERRADEVVYYGTDDPYGMRVRRMDSHGGWLASPTDLLRFAVRADGFATVPDLLRRDTITTMTTPSAANSGYACGWAVNTSNNWWHTGRLPGTESVLVRTGNEFCWAAVANGNGVDLDAMMWDVYREVAAWPAHDLF